MEKKDNIKTIDPSNISCGLDFGTSNSVISVTDLSTGEELFTSSLQSILYFPASDAELCYVGKEAEEKYVEEQMKGRLLKSVKTLLKQDKFLFTWINGKKITPDRMASYIIRKLKDSAEAFLGFEIEKVILGRPAIFSEKEEEETTAVKRLLTATHNAGFKEVHLQLEPIAAAFSYEQRLTRESLVLVADFGGGTSDFSIVRLSPEKLHVKDRSNDILAHGGLYIGGDMFDSEIMWYKVTPLLGRGVKYKSYDKYIEVPNTLYRELRNWERSFLLKDSSARRMLDKYYVFSDYNSHINNAMQLIDNNYVYSLFKEIERSKIALSEHPVTELCFQNQHMAIRESITFGEYEEVINSHVSRIKEYIETMMEESGYECSSIDSVYLTGGSSLSKPIKNVFNDMFGAERVHCGDTFHSVAHGLSLTRI